MTAHIAATALPLAVATGVVGAAVLAVRWGERAACEWAENTDSEETP